METLGSRPRLIIVCGLPGSGKTSHATQLQGKLGAIRFCPDEWMTTLEIDLYDQKKRERIEVLQWTFAERLLALRQTVIIEWGTWARSERDALRVRARTLGAAVELHCLDAPTDVLLSRIRERNQGRPLIESDDLLKWVDMFERPSPDEMALFDAPSA